MPYPTDMVRFIHPLHVILLCFLAVFAPALAPTAKAAGFEEFYRFPRLANFPTGLIRGSTGDLYGVSGGDGLNRLGTLYRVSATNGALETLAHFNQFAGSVHSTRIATDSFGNIYGLSELYGPTGFGKAIWRWNATTGLTPIALLSPLGLSGNIFGVISDNSGGVVGTSSGEGASPGTLWRWHPSTGAQRLGDFVEATTGKTTRTQLAVDSQGGIYGRSDDSNDATILWRWTDAAGFEKLATLPKETYGLGGSGVSIDASDHVWGVTSMDTTYQHGALWRWSQADGIVKLGDFNTTGVFTRQSPIVFAADGTPFWMSNEVIFQWTSATGVVEVADVLPENTGFAEGAIALDSTGSIYGTLYDGAPNHSVWKWSAQTGVVKLQDFSSTQQEYVSEQGIARDQQGRIYGTTAAGFSSEPSVLWRWSDSGGYEVLANFDRAIFGVGTSLPNVDSAGNVYGVLVDPLQGESFPGQLWRWNVAEGLVKLADFDAATDGYALPSIVIGNAGQIYGTSRFWVPAKGSLWKWTAASGIQNVAAFDHPSAAFAPGQITGAQGEWYGTQTSGNIPGGLLWSYSTSAGLVIHHEFSTAEDSAYFPRAALDRDAAGNIYGLTWGSGTLWKWNANTGLTILTRFVRSQPGNLFESGMSPISLRVNPNGSVSGVCELDGAYGAGTIWNWSEGSGLAAIHHFHPQSVGRVEAPGLVSDDDGNLYGVVNGLLWRYAGSDLPAAPLAVLGAPQHLDEGVTRFVSTVTPNVLNTLFRLRVGDSPENLQNTDQFAIATGTAIRRDELYVRNLPQRRLLFADVFVSNSQGTSRSNLISFINPNRSPEANDDHVHSPSIESGSFLVDVLANDSDGEDTLTLSSVDYGRYGTAQVVNNQVRYTPGPEYQGEDQLTYTVKDGHGGTSNGALKLVNFLVKAKDDVITRGDGSLTIYPLTNDVDQDHDPIRIVSVTQPQQGAVEVNADSLVYTPGSDFFGTERFTYTVTDGRGSVATATVEVRPGSLSYRKLLSIGDVIPNPAVDFTVKAFGATGAGPDGMLRVQTEAFGVRNWTVLNRDDLSIALRTGEPLPNAAETSITSIEETAGRAVLVRATPDGMSHKPRRSLIFLRRGMSPQLVASEGAPLPDGILMSIDCYSEANGSVFLLGKVARPNGKIVQSLLAWSNGTMNELIRSGVSEIQGMLVKSITTLVPVPGSRADNRWIDDAGRITARVKLKNNRQAIGIWQAGQEPNIPVLTGLNGPIGGDVVRLGLPALCPNGMAFRAMDLGFRDLRRWSVFGPDDDGDLGTLAEPGDFATFDPEAFFTRFADPVTGGSGNFAFMADITNKRRAWMALFWYHHSERQLIVRKGDLLPGSDSERFGSIKSIILPPNSSRGPVFTAMIGNALSLWATNDSGELVLVAKRGMSLTIDGIERTVASVRALEGSKGRGIAPRGIDDLGRVEALVKFTDGAESLIQFALP